MAKDDQQRIDDTLDFLKTRVLVPAASIQTKAYQLAQDYVNAAFPPRSGVARLPAVLAKPLAGVPFEE